MVSLMWLSVFSQWLISDSNTTKYLEAFMVDSVTMFSSRAAKISSVLWGSVCSGVRKYE